MKKLLFALAFCFPLISCDRQSLPEDSLEGDWRLESFNSVEPQNAFIAQPDWNECPNCFTLTFKNDGLVLGTTTHNSVSGKYEVNFNSRHFKFKNLISTEIRETGDGNKFRSILENVKSFQISEQELKLFYLSDAQVSYLLFKKNETPIKKTE